MRSVLSLSFILLFILFGCSVQHQKSDKFSVLKITSNHRYFTTGNNSDFFWLGDTGWLLLSKLNRQDIDRYFSIREQQGFNVIQVMVLHGLDAVDFYGDSALMNLQINQPDTLMDQNARSDSLTPGYWSQLDYAVQSALEHKLYIALVPVWGGVVKSGNVTEKQAEVYSSFLARRYRSYNNIIWLNGGDVLGSDSLAIWNKIGETLKQKDGRHLISFHPRGRMQSVDWFLKEDWLDFNLFQSGHRRYDQDDTSRGYGEDNWKYVNEYWTVDSMRPTLDGEPSYEGIPQGLHDTLQPYWKAADVRRYAYWSVFAGAAGFTYGHSAVMQFFSPSDSGSAYGAKEYWTEAINAPGALQMKYLKALMLAHPFANRRPAQDLLARNKGQKYHYQLATCGDNYGLVYTYCGDSIFLQPKRLHGSCFQLSWFNPRTGEKQKAGDWENKQIKAIVPPGIPGPGNDWVLEIEKSRREVAE